MPCLTFKWPSFYCVCTLCIFSLYNIQNFIVTWESCILCKKNHQNPKPSFLENRRNFEWEMEAG